MITAVTDPQYISQILELAKRALPNQWQGLEPKLYKALNSPDDIILADVENGVLLGYLLASVIIWTGEKAILIVSCAAEKGRIPLSMQKEILTRLEEGARSEGIKKILGFTRRNPRAFERYGFKPISTIIARDVT